VGSRPLHKNPESRQELFNHLTFIFPKEQVEQVMELLPEEENPKVLCAAIMKMFQ
jgi:hypothetical protein